MLPFDNDGQRGNLLRRRCLMQVFSFSLFFLTHSLSLRLRLCSSVVCYKAKGKEKIDNMQKKEEQKEKSAVFETHAYAMEEKVYPRLSLYFSLSLSLCTKDIGKKNQQCKKHDG